MNLSLTLPHELRTPLVGILGGAEFLMQPDEANDPESVDEARQYESARAGICLHRMVENTLLYANLKLVNLTGDEALPQIEHVTRGLTETIKNAAQEMARERSRETDLKLNLTDVDIQISDDNFKKICTEIIDNAFKFSKTGSACHS